MLFRPPRAQSGIDFLTAGSVVAHCFMEDARQTYDLEGLWAHDDGSNLVHIQGPQTLDTLHAI